MLEWRLHEEFCLSNSLGVAAARVKLAADLFEASPWWSVGIYDGGRKRWVCGLHPRKNNVGDGSGTHIRSANRSPVRKAAAAPPNAGGAATAAVDRAGQFSLVDPVMGSDGSGGGDGAKRKLPPRRFDTDEIRRHAGSAFADSPQQVDPHDASSLDYLEIAGHFGTIPERWVCLCPCLHARRNYFEARSQLRYCSMRTGFINSHNNRVSMEQPEDNSLMLPNSFDFAEYISHILGEHLAEMVDVSVLNWCTLWVVFGIFMAVDFEDLLRLKTQGFALAMASIAGE